MINPYHGEVALVLNGETLPMRLTLGALAELENTLQEKNLFALIERFEKGHFKVNDISDLLFAGLRGAGWNGTKAMLLSGKIKGGPMQAARLAGQLLVRSFGPPDEC